MGTRRRSSVGPGDGRSRRKAGILSEPQGPVHAFEISSARPMRNRLIRMPASPRLIRLANQIDRIGFDEKSRPRLRRTGDLVYRERRIGRGIRERAK